MVTIADINKATEDCFKKAAEIFGVDLSATRIEYNLRGKTAAMAGCRTFQGARAFKLRYNKEAILIDSEDFIKNTIPHEVAHLVCYAARHLGKNHDRGWQNVCIRLGGTAARTHKLKLTPARRTKRYAYIATCGTAITMSAVRHNKIQRCGTTYTVKSTRGQLNRDCQYKRVA